MPTAAPLPRAPDDLAVLRRWARASQLPAVTVRRARRAEILARLNRHTRPTSGAGWQVGAITFLPT
jgi:hypothetical protein